MLKILGSGRGRFCDGVSRRDFLRVGALGMGGMALPDLLRAEEGAGVGRSKKAVIMIYMAGAPGHQDLYDLKMDAPREYRGEFVPMKTNVAGIEISELLPGLARNMDKLVPIRSLVGAPNGAHDSFMPYTGRKGSSLNLNGQPPGGWPSMGSVLSRVMGPVDPGVPAFVGLAPKTGHPPYGSPGHPGFLGAEHAAFRPAGEGRGDLELGEGVTLERLSGRRGLLRAFDNFRRGVDTSGGMAGMDAYTEQAFGVLTSSKLAEALDLEKEDPRVRERYGKGDAKNFGDGAPRNLEHFLMARRLVEAGARCVTLNFGRWDFHGKNADGLRSHAPMFDRGLSALIEDLYERGMDEDVSVVAWGEFGRTPKLNDQGGRDHWPAVGCGLLSGGGMRTGQVIGATDRLGGEATERPVHFGEVFATLYQNLGLDPNVTTVPDLSGRPHYLVDGWRPMRELV